MNPNNIRRYQANPIIYDGIEKPEVCHSYTDRMALGKKLRVLFDEYYSNHKIFSREHAEQLRGSIIPDVLSMGDIVFIRLRQLFERDPQKALFTFL